jgi:hypothetical protein
VYCSPYAVIAVVGTKNDLETERIVSKEEGETFALANGLLFYETSALIGANVDKV